MTEAVRGTAAAIWNANLNLRGTGTTRRLSPGPAFHNGQPSSITAHSWRRVNAKLCMWAIPGTTAVVTWGGTTVSGGLAPRIGHHVNFARRR